MEGIFRVMHPDGDKPLVGHQSKMLGVREDGTDIQVDPSGNVHPRTGGLSVAPHWTILPPFLIPRRLSDKAPDAAGNANLVCFRHSQSRYESGPMNENLDVRVESPRHGLIEPSSVMPLQSFQSALASTRDAWVKDEELPE